MSSKFEKHCRKKYGFYISPKNKKLLRSKKIRDYFLYLHEEITKELLDKIFLAIPMSMKKPKETTDAG